MNKIDIYNYLIFILKFLMRKVLLSFYTEGYPYDLGKNLINQKDAFLEIGKKYFDEVIIFCPRELKKLDPNWNYILYDESFF